MWRVVVAGRPDESSPENNGTLLSSEVLPPPPGVGMGYHNQTHHPHHQQQAQHYPGSQPQGHYPPSAYYHPHPHPHHPHHPHHPQQQYPEHQAASSGPCCNQPQQQPHQQAPLQRSLQKRSHAVSSMSDSDCDDVFSEESGKEPCNSPQLQSVNSAPTGGADSCQHSSRKRRRGMIEKKRRDRINASLSELRRLVPSAARDPHSGKLEKAEILQLTVEHLRALKNTHHQPQLHAVPQHVKGDGVNVDPGYPGKGIQDYHAIGWGECTAEVGRYLVSMEGLDERDPLRLRLLSHLQGYHRELSSPQEVASPTTTTTTTTTIKYEQTSPNSNSSTNNNNNTTSTSASLSWTTPGVYHPHGHNPAHGSGGYHHHLHHPGAGPGPASGSAYHHQQQHSVGKPYRPWGAELAY